MKNIYLPTLLQRLQNDEPKNAHELPTSIDTYRMQSLIKKAIVELINHTNIEDELNAQSHMLIMNSVINYGIPAFIGVSGSRKDWIIIEKQVREAILRFEPRIIPETLLVRSVQDGNNIGRHAVITLEIRGVIYWPHKNIDLCISGEYDVDAEKFNLTTQL